MQHQDYSFAFSLFAKKVQMFHFSQILLVIFLLRVRLRFILEPRHTIQQLMVLVISMSMQMG